jgi:hypothetical protein
MPGADHFDGHANLTLAQRRGGAPILAELLGAPERSRFVDPYTLVAPDHQDGSIGAPYSTLQAAVDDIEENIDTTIWTPTIYAAAGLYEENLVICKATCLTVAGVGRTKTTVIDPPTGVALTITNATRESLDTYRTSGTYSDLVNNGPGPREISFTDIYIHGNGAQTNHAIELLGVKGDASPTTTDFLDAGGPQHQGGVFYNCSFDRMCFAKNAGYPYFAYGVVGAFKFYNCAGPAIASVVPNNTATSILSYVPAHADGEPSHGNIGFYPDLSTMYTLQVEGEGLIAAADYEGTLDIYGNLDLRDDAEVYLRRPWLSGDLLAEAAATAVLDAPHIKGDVTLATGAGAIVFNGGEYMGTLGGAGAGRLTHNLGNIGT